MIVNQESLFHMDIMGDIKIPEGIKLNFVNWGVANRFGEEIEMNVNLIEYPELFQDILKHELGHRKNKSFTADLKHDLNPRVNPSEMIKFMLTHPKSLTQLFPVYFTKKKGFVYDINLSLIYIVALLFVSMTSYIAWRIV
jgi:hypothetical protein